METSYCETNEFRFFFLSAIVKQKMLMEYTINFHEKEKQATQQHMYISWELLKNCLQTFNSNWSNQEPLVKASSLRKTHLLNSQLLNLQMWEKHFNTFQTFLWEIKQMLQHRHSFRYRCVRNVMICAYCMYVVWNPSESNGFEYIYVLRLCLWHYSKIKWQQNRDYDMCVSHMNRTV